MQCVVLAAGEGKRMRPLTANRPKVMIPVANHPMVEHLVIAARDAGVNEFIFVVGYGEKAIRGHFGNGKDLGVKVRYVTQRQQKGTADALNAAKNHVSGNFLLMNGDMIMNSEDIRAIIRKKPFIIGVYPSDHPEDYGVVVTEGDMVRSLEEKSEQPESDLINAGIYLLSPEIFEISGQVKCSSRGEYELTDALAILIAGKRLESHLLTSWIDVGYPWDLLWANERLLSSAGTKNEGIIEDGVWIHGEVSIGSGSVIKSGTYIEGPCCIGKNSRIGPHAYIRGSTSIGDECHIGHSTEIKNSIVMNGTKIPHFNYVGDSVIGSGCNFGAGTKVANLRHDHAPVQVCGKNSRRIKMGAIVGDGVQLGINCSVNVGAVIGSNVIAAPHSVIDGCISPDTKIR